MKPEQETGEPNPENTDDSNGISRKPLIGGGVAVIGVLTTGLLVYTLARSGQSGAEKFVWILGYGATIFALWYLLLRPIDFSASVNVETETEDGSDS